ncbi:MAG: hypothetical protein EWV78_08945 [Microcystis aeruginosa Ma_MB_F_20061100_S20D]|uniref:Uncharacterized protein n=1 Tax=Microcystis aeruginosa Ma_MB_F_20061100_S20D TaxID=2486253 RepID=A0A552EQ04_MICAE|nr:MAG: hypothetical protein EWV78_08945 [Microcystis aeruginosa Ma_MB_F_20061100_S20D]
MKTTRYFEEQVLVKRPYLKREWCQQAIQNPVRREIEPNGRIRHWLYIPELGKYFQVIPVNQNSHEIFTFGQFLLNN